MIIDSINKVISQVKTHYNSNGIEIVNPNGEQEKSTDSNKTNSTPTNDTEVCVQIPKQQEELGNWDQVEYVLNEERSKKNRNERSRYSSF